MFTWQHNEEKDDQRHDKVYRYDPSQEYKVGRNHGSKMRFNTFNFPLPGNHVRHSFPDPPAEKSDKKITKTVYYVIFSLSLNPEMLLRVF